MQRCLFLNNKLSAKQKQSPSSQLAHVCNRMFCNLEGKDVLRSRVEEFLLASEYTPHDELAAEFIRTFRHTYCFGNAYLDRLDDILRKKNEITLERCILILFLCTGVVVPTRVRSS